MGKRMTISLSLDSDLVPRIDQTAQMLGMTRSGFATVVFQALCADGSIGEAALLLLASGLSAARKVDEDGGVQRVAQTLVHGNA